MTRHSNLQRQADLKLKEDKPNVPEVKDLVGEISEFRRMNGGLLLLVFLMLCIGLVLLFSVSLSSSYMQTIEGDANALYFFAKQLRFTILGFVAAVLIGRFIPIKKFNNIFWGGAVYGVTTLLLLIVAAKGHTALGAQRWIKVGPLSLQPSEIAKIAAVFFLAFYFSEVRNRRTRGLLDKGDAKKQFFWDGIYDIVIPAVMMGIWLVLILMQPHLSGAIIFTLVVAACFFIAKIPMKSWIAGMTIMIPIILALFIVLFAAFPLIANGKSMPEFVEDRFAHVFRRIETHENPEGATDDEIYQVRQAKLAMGSGGLTGMGLGQGRQKFNYLPMSYNDYIFPAIGEELGFLGTTAIVGLFLAFFLIGMRITLKANSLFAVVVAWGYTLLITIQALLHMAVTLNLIPATGISLPFFSYGGSSNVFFLIAVGILLSVSRTAQRSPKELREVLGREAQAEERRRQQNKAKARIERKERRPERKMTFSRAVKIVARRILAPKPKKQAPKRPRPEPSLDYPRIKKQNSSSFSSGGFKRTRAYLEERERYSS